MSAQRRVGPSGVSLVRIHASPDTDNGTALDTGIDDDLARRRADDLDAEAAYYRRRAIQEEQALGPGHYVNLLRSIATDRAAMAQRIRTATERRGEAPRNS